MSTKKRMRELALEIAKAEVEVLKNEQSEETSPSTDMWMGGLTQAESTKGEGPVYGYTLIALSMNKNKVKGLAEILGTFQPLW